MEHKSMTEERIIEIEIERLKSFKEHPFKIQPDQQMKQLRDSIEQYGIFTPLVVRPLLEGNYEVISGHRRKYVAEQLGYRKVPVLIRVMKDNEAVVKMVDSNIQRELLSPSEKAFAYKMKSDALKKMGKRFNGSQTDHDRKGKRMVQILGDESGESPKQVQRYLKLTELIPELLEKLDDGILSFTPAVELAFLKEEEQKMFIQAMDYTQAIPSLSQAQRIKNLSKEGTLTEEKMREILREVKKGDINRVIFKNEQLYKYFPKSYTPERMKREILEILKTYMESCWEN